MNDWSRRVVVGAFVALTFVFFWRPLLGVGSLLPNDLLDGSAPWSAERTPERPDNPWLSDTIDVHAQFAAIGDDVRDGDLSWWDRSLTGGLPTLKAGFSPLMLPYLLVPAAYAPGLVAALRVLVAGGGLYGYLRRGLGTDRSAALVGAVAYGFTGYLVGWAAWPQSNVAAFAPLLLWSVEMLVRDPRPRRAIPVAGSVAAMFLSNFPLAAAYVLIAVAFYAVGRLVSRHGLRPFDRLVRASLPATAWAATGIALGMAVISIYLSEFLTYVDFNDTSARDAIPADSSTGTRFLLTLVLPWAYGSAHQGPTFWADGTNWIEAQGYVGASVALLALAALAIRRTPGPGHERAIVVRLLWAIAVFGLWVSYVGGPLTEAFQSLPLIGSNSIGRSRVISHLAFAALAGLGVQALIDHRRAVDGVDVRRAARNGLVVLAVAGLAFSPWLLDWGREARARGVLQQTIEQAWLPVLAAIAVVALIGWLLRSSPSTGVIAAIAVVIVGVELFGFGRSVITVVDDAEGDYDTASHDLVAELLEPGERLSGDARTFWANTNQVTDHDDVRGHVFYPAGWREVFDEIQPGAFEAPGTITNPWFGAEADADHPLLDALAVGVWADSPGVPVRGERIEAPEPDDGSDIEAGQTLWSGTVTVDVVVPDTGLRAVTISAADPPPSFDVTVRIGDLVTTERVVGAASGSLVDIAIPGEDLPAGVTTIELTTSAPLEVTTLDGVPALGLVTPGNDGLRLVAAGPVTLYERPGAAAAWFVPGVSPADIDLTVHGPSAPGSAPISPAIIEGGRVELAVTAAESGTVVVSQYAFPGWSATVDGASVPIADVDDLIAGVAIDAGDHTVVFAYAPRRLGRLSLLTVAALIALAGLWFVDRQGRPASRHTNAAA